MLSGYVDVKKPISAVAKSQFCNKTITCGILPAHTVCIQPKNKTAKIRRTFTSRVSRGLTNCLYLLYTHLLQPRRANVTFISYMLVCFSPPVNVTLTGIFCVCFAFSPRATFHQGRNQAMCVTLQ